MDRDDLLAQVTRHLVKGKSHSSIANSLGLSKDELNEILAEIRSKGEKILSDDEMKYYVIDTLVSFSELERVAWDELESLDDVSDKIKLIKLISQIRMDSLDVRKEFNLIAPKRKKDIPYQKIEELSEKVRIEISRLAIKHLDQLESLPEPVPFQAPEQIDQLPVSVVTYESEEDKKPK